METVERGYSLGGSNGGDEKPEAKSFELGVKTRPDAFGGTMAEMEEGVAGTTGELSP